MDRLERKCTKKNMERFTNLRVIRNARVLLPDNALNSDDESVGPDNIPGYGKVEALAETLFNLQTNKGSLTNEEANTIIALWNSLTPYDKEPTRFPPRYQIRQIQGRLKNSKSTIAPGVESTKRCFLGQNSGPAQWPNCNRYVECLVSKLCNCFPSTRRVQGHSTLRWTLICRAYKDIRQKILNNAMVMRETAIQLVEINQTTLTQWYNKKSKKEEKAILKQGLSLPTPPLCTSEPLSSPVQKPVLLPAPSVKGPFVFLLPMNTAGQSKTRSQPVCNAYQPTTSTSDELPQCSQPQMLYPALPPNTKWYRKHKLEREAAGIPCRKYVKKSDVIICKKCGKERSKQDHKQYFGNWFCSLTSVESYEEWRTKFEEKSYKKKKME